MRDVLNKNVKNDDYKTSKVLIVNEYGNLPMPLNDEFFSIFPNIKVLVTFSIGYDYLDLSYLQSKGIIVGRAFDTEDTVADHTMALLLAGARLLLEGDKETRDPATTYFNIMNYVFNTMEIHNNTVGLIGFGAIGQKIAKRCYCGFDMNVLYYCRHRRSEEIEKLYNCKYCEKLDDLLKESDYVILICILFIIFIYNNSTIQ